MPKLIKSLLLLLFVFSFCQDIIIVKSFGQKQEKTLNPLQKLKGLNNAVALSIIKDSRGFMWFTTQYGLIRYNGYDFKTYSYNPEDSTSIPNLFSMISRSGIEPSTRSPFLKRGILIPKESSPS